MQICIENLFYRRFILFILCAFLVEMQSYQTNKLPTQETEKKIFWNKKLMKKIPLRYDFYLPKVARMYNHLCSTDYF